MGVEMLRFAQHDKTFPISFVKEGRLAIRFRLEIEQFRVATTEGDEFLV